MTTGSDVDQVCELAQRMPAATREYPFGPEAAVFKVGGKMFALVSQDGPEYVTLKVDPDDGLALRAEYSHIREGHYMNKHHWVTIDLGPDAEMTQVIELVEDSYALVVATLTKKLRAELGFVVDETAS